MGTPAWTPVCIFRVLSARRQRTIGNNLVLVPLKGLLLLHMRPLSLSHSATVVRCLFQTGVGVMAVMPVPDTTHESPIDNAID